MSLLQPSLLEPDAALPGGFRYRPELIAPEQAQELVARFRDLPFQPFEFHGYLGKRRVVSFGLRYDFGEGRVRETSPIPEWLFPLQAGAANFAGLGADALVHALVTEYDPGAPIGWHRDRPVFGDVIGMSFVSPCRFRFRRRLAGKWQRQDITLAPRSAYLLRGPARTEWEHSIPPAEELRYSVTFRTLRGQ